MVRGAISLEVPRFRLARIPSITAAGFQAGYGFSRLIYQEGDLLQLPYFVTFTDVFDLMAENAFHESLPVVHRLTEGYFPPDGAGSFAFQDKHLISAAVQSVDHSACQISAATDDYYIFFRHKLFSTSCLTPFHPRLFRIIFDPRSPS